MCAGACGIDIELENKNSREWDKRSASSQLIKEVIIQRPMSAVRGHEVNKICLLIHCYVVVVLGRIGLASVFIRVVRRVH